MTRLDKLIVSACVLAALACFAGMAWGQDRPPVDPDTMDMSQGGGRPKNVYVDREIKAGTPPVITAEMQHEFVETQLALELATLKAEVAQTKLDKFQAGQRAQKAIAAMQAVCPLTLDQQTGKMQCAPKPEPPEPAKGPAK